MKYSQNHTTSLGLPLRFLIIAFILLGIFFRFTNLDRKVYWNDEVFTSLRVSGYTEEDIQQVYNGRIVSVEELLKFQRINPEKSTVDTLKSLTVEGAQHPPLYFLLVRFWGQLFGNSVTVTRSLSAFFSFLALPATYWLCRELFKSPLVGWMAMALIAISPFHVLYAQAARQYSLWSLVTLLSSWALLRAMRLKTKLGWGIYGGTVILGIYTFPFFLFVTLGHGVYILTIEGFQFSRVKSFLVSLVAATIAFTPWIVYAILSLRHVRKTTNWLSYSFKNGIPELIFSWLRHIARLFLDFEANFNFGYSNPFPYLVAVIALVALAGYSISFLCCHTSKKTWLFLLTLIAATALPLILPDLILGGRRSGITRYLLPSYLGIQICIAYLLATKITSKSVSAKKQRWQAVAIALFVLGSLSCANSASAPVWWNNGPSKIGKNPEVAATINQASHPLVISNEGWGNIISLSHSLTPKVQFQLVEKDKIPEIPDDFSTYFLYKPSQDLRENLAIKQGYTVEPMDDESSKPWLWRLEK